MARLSRFLQSGVPSPAGDQRSPPPSRRFRGSKAHAGGAYRRWLGAFSRHLPRIGARISGRHSRPSAGGRASIRCARRCPTGRRLRNRKDFSIARGPSSPPQGDAFLQARRLHRRHHRTNPAHVAARGRKSIRAPGSRIWSRSSRRARSLPLAPRVAGILEAGAGAQNGAAASPRINACASTTVR